VDATGLQELATKQGPLFWGAAAAAALGGSLLVAALAMQARRFRPRIAWRGPRLRLRRGRAPVPAFPAAPLARAVPGGYAPAGVTGYAASTRPAAAPAGSAAAAGLSPDYTVALTRLRRASEKLARLQADSGESRLKATAGGADLMYRQGVG
jgi:hypothetical protein